MSTTLAPIDEVKQSLQRMTPSFKAALPPQIPVERFVRIVQTAVQSNTDLLECDRMTLYASAMRCAQDGLLPDGREAAIVKFGGVATYMPMVAGILKKVRNSGELKTITAEVVCEADSFDHWSDETGEHFTHRRARKDRGGPILTYAYAITKEGGLFFEEIDEQAMQVIRSCSRAKDGGPWVKFADEMRRKSAIRRLAKRLPVSTDLYDFLRTDDDLYDLNAAPAAPEPPVEPRDVTPAKKRPRGLQKAMASKPAEPAAPEPPKPAEPQQGTIVDMI